MTTRRSPMWMQNVDQPHDWALKRKGLLETVFSLFDREGEWPRIESVQRALASSDPERAVAVAQLAIDIPHELGAREVDRLALTVRALTYCDSAASLLEDFVAVMGQALAAFPGEEQHPAALSGFRRQGDARPGRPHLPQGFDARVPRALVLQRRLGQPDR